MTTERTRSASIGLIPVREPLARDEEVQLHQAILAGRSAAARLASGDATGDEVNTLRRLVRQGRHAEESLLAGTCALVKHRVRELGFSVDQDDLEAAGLEGLVRALRSFDPSRGARFATYANYWINKMVFAAISHRVPYPEQDLRQVIRYRRLERRHGGSPPSVTEVARQLGLSRTDAARIMRMSGDITAGTSALEPDELAAEDSAPWPEADWIIVQLKEILGRDFEDFWMWTGRVMSLEELGRRNGISKQAMSKRVARWRRLVESSPRADEMIAWLRAQ